MNTFFKSAKVLTLLSLGVFFSQTLAQNFCNATGHSGQSVTETKDFIQGSIGDYKYEQWYRGGSNSTTFYEDGSFTCNFSGTDDFLCRAGKSYSKDVTWQQIGHLYADFSVEKRNLSNIGYSFIGVYGWTVSPLVEFYIVDDWGSAYRPSNSSWVHKGTVTVDGGVYDIYYNRQINQPAIEGGNTDFDQYYSVRREARSCGTIDITAHFEAWSQIPDWELGKMYEAKVLGEAGGGSATGIFDFKYARVYLGEGSTSSSSSTVNPTSSATVERSPFSSNSIPGTIEFENFDYGGEGVGYHNGTYSTDYSPSGYRSEEVEVIGVGSGYGVGYISANDWLEYTVNVASAGTYDFEVTAGTGMSNASVINVTAGTATAEVSIPATPDDWGTYSATAGTINLAAGKQIIRFTFTSGNVNVDKVKFTKKGSTSSSSSVQPSSSSVQRSSSSVRPSSSSQAPVVVATLPGTLQFEDYQNSGGELQNNGTSLGSIDPKAWVEYTVDFSSAGVYEFMVSVAREDNTNHSPSNLSVAIDGVKVGTVTGILTDGWNDYQNFSTTTTNISAGQHTLRVTFDYGYVNADYMKFTEVSSSSVQEQSSESTSEQSSTSVQEESSASTLEPSSASVQEESSASSLEATSSSITESIANILLSADRDHDLQVFDMQGRFLGRVTVARGASLEETLRARFQSPGIYLVKLGNRFMQARVTR